MNPEKPSALFPRWQIISGILLLLCFVLTSYAILLQRKFNLSQSQQVLTNSKIVEAQRATNSFGELALEAFDLQQELGFRSNGPIPTEPVKFEAPLDRPEIRPVPLVFTSTLTVPERNEIRSRLDHMPRLQRNPVSVLYNTQDTTTAAELRRLGYLVIKVDTAASLQINSVVFGDSVSFDDVQLVTLALVDAGIRPSRIRRMYGSGKSRSVTLTYVPYAVTWSPLTFAQINRLTNPN